MLNKGRRITVKKFFEIIKKKWIADTTRVVLLVALLVVVYIAINILAEKLNLPTLDFTEEKLYSVFQYLR